MLYFVLAQILALSPLALADQSLKGQKLEDLLTTSELRGCLSLAEKKYGQKVRVNEATYVLESRSVVNTLRVVSFSDASDLGTITVFETVNPSVMEDRFLEHMGIKAKISCYLD